MRTHMRGLLIVVALLAGGLGAFAQVKPFRPVTDEMLRNPPPADWLQSRRTYDGWSYSPLDQINRQNVGQLQLAWSWAMLPGNQQTTPLVHDGVMYLVNPGSAVQALDAVKGDLLWEYRREFPEAIRAQAEMRAMRGLSIYDDKVFLNTADAHLVALDARTGRVVWDVEVADPAQRQYYSAAVARRARQGHLGTAGLRVLRAAEVRDHRARRQHRQGAVAHLDDRPSR